jgi:hypothetical protein
MGACVYIEKRDFEYFENFIKGLDKDFEKKFLAELFKLIKQNTFDRIVKIYVVNSEIIKDRKIEPTEIITKYKIDTIYEKIKATTERKENK